MGGVAPRSLHMTQTEHLPIYKAAYDLCLYLEQIVGNFSRAQGDAAPCRDAYRPCDTEWENGRRQRSDQTLHKVFAPFEKQRGQCPKGTGDLILPAAEALSSNPPRLRRCPLSLRKGASTQKPYLCGGSLGESGAEVVVASFDAENNTAPAIS